MNVVLTPGMRIQNRQHAPIDFHRPYSKNYKFNISNDIPDPEELDSGTGHAVALQLIGAIRTHFASGVIAFKFQQEECCPLGNPGGLSGLILRNGRAMEFSYLTSACFLQLPGRLLIN